MYHGFFIPVEAGPENTVFLFLKYRIHPICFSLHFTYSGHERRGEATRKRGGILDLRFENSR
jgi:hypothetical protein